MISFKASTINTVELKKINKYKNSECYKGKFVELYPNSFTDYDALRAIGLSWNRGDSFAGDIFDVFAKDRFCNKKFKDVKHRFFAITKKNSIAPLLKAHDILGVAALTEEKDNSHTLKYLQVDPEHKHGSEKRVYKQVGKALVEAIQKLSNVKEINLYAVDHGAEIFYEKLNFKKIQDTIYMRFKR